MEFKIWLTSLPDRKFKSGKTNERVVMFTLFKESKRSREIPWFLSHAVGIMIWMTASISFKGISISFEVSDVTTRLGDTNLWKLKDWRFCSLSHRKLDSIFLQFKHSIWASDGGQCEDSETTFPAANFASFWGNVPTTNVVSLRAASFEFHQHFTRAFLYESALRSFFLLTVWL